MLAASGKTSKSSEGKSFEKYRPSNLSKFNMAIFEKLFLHQLFASHVTRKNTCDPQVNTTHQKVNNKNNPNQVNNINPK